MRYILLEGNFLKRCLLFFFLFHIAYATSPLPSKLGIKGIVLLGECEPLLNSQELEKVEGVVAMGISVPGKFHLLQERLAPFLFSIALSSETLASIKREIYRYFEEEGEPFILVTVPEQNVSLRVVQIVIRKGTIGFVRVEGSAQEERLKQALGALPGETIDLRSLQRNLRFINNYPFRHADLIYSPGEKWGTTDLTLVVKERRPWRLYAGVDNTGVETTSRQRLFSGFNAGNLWGIDHLLAFQYISAYDFHRFQGYSGQYLAPLPWRHLLNFYGGYSSVHADLPIPSMRNSGYSAQGSLRYEIPFRWFSQANLEFAFGADLKSTNNTIEFSETFPNISRTVNLWQWVFKGSWIYERAHFRCDGEMQLCWSLSHFPPQSWLANRTDADYQALQPDAVNHWLYGKLSLKYLYDLPYKFSFLLWLRGQLSSQTLLSSEQIGIGGYDTVRGYEERQLNTDNGVLATWEVRTPLISLVNRFRQKLANDALQFLAFVDFGYGFNHQSLPTGDPNNDILAGTGPGLRYTLDPYITCRFDCGFKLRQRALYGGGMAMVHFSAIVSY